MVLVDALNIIVTVLVHSQVECLLQKHVWAKIQIVFQMYER